MNDSFYRDYEDLHRGSRELIKTRLRAYLPFVAPLIPLFASASAVDLGCGRGEWIELLGETGFDAFGVDLDEGMLAACRERGLRACHADAFQTLREMADSSMAIVSAFHVVEHMPFSDVRVLIDEALRVLRPGGLLILETPNPENLVVGASSFYQDPSHERPIPPELLRFAVQHAGFGRARIVRLQEAPELRSPSVVRLIHVLNGVSPDYSVVAQKAASAEVMAECDAAFDAKFGVTLEALAQGYDALAERRFTDSKQLIAQAEGRLAYALQHATDHASNRIAQIEQWIMQADVRAAQTEARINQIETRTAEAEARAALANSKLQAVLQSRSWRITAPIRYAGDTSRRVIRVIREGRVVSTSKRRASLALRRIGQAILQRPRLMRTALWFLNHTPGLKYRLRDFMRTPADTPHTQHIPSGHLSPRAERIYSDLKKAMDTRKN